MNASTGGSEAHSNVTTRVHGTVQHGRPHWLRYLGTARGKSNPLKTVSACITNLSITSKRSSFQDQSIVGDLLHFSPRVVVVCGPLAPSIVESIKLTFGRVVVTIVGPQKHMFRVAPVVHHINAIFS
ncbi:hypothetical protein PISMIDRAFT_192842 [Pisolithus microcarpus 441]|uniref:Uncharacterized protein n=1 Tax=Pisolithus microcarpus 441 TaxID=765257 RepID=A0A0C9Z794_9AGAM|nr:hypothetical protein PISMIDRAFT_192842 [Pisolithus microcarpus 441]